jgi:predicted lipoprotein with Yx(FWY)xxD motif
MVREALSGAPIVSNAHGQAPGWQSSMLRVTGAGLLFATGGIHLDLYLTGYQTVPTIGWLFLLQVISAFGLGAVVLASGSRLASAAGAGFALATLGGYLLTLWIGLFGFREVRTTAGIVAGVVEVGAFAALSALALAPRKHRPPAGPTTKARRLPDRVPAAIPGAGRAVAALSVLAVAVLSISVAAEAPTTTGSPASLLKVAKIAGVRVLTNARGYTLYWFVPDTPLKSSCYGACAAYWPPVTGSPTAGPGLKGALGTIRRLDGTTQATYDGHPLYTYIGDAAPGQANGNNINLNGGVWHEVVASS